MPRMTRTKRAALDALAELGSNFDEWGEPPYAVSDIARHIGADLSNLAKTMKLLEREGLVVREVAVRECWNGRYCINDLHRAAGGEAKHQPALWLRSAQVQDLINELKHSTNSQTEPNQPLRVQNGGNAPGIDRASGLKTVPACQSSCSSSCRVRPRSSDASGCWRR